MMEKVKKFLKGKRGRFVVGLILAGLVIAGVITEEQAGQLSIMVGF